MILFGLIWQSGQNAPKRNERNQAKLRNLRDKTLLGKLTICSLKISFLVAKEILISVHKFIQTRKAIIKTIQYWNIHFELV